MWMMWLECLKVRNQNGMTKIILSIIVISLLPISVFGVDKSFFDWTVTYKGEWEDGGFKTYNKVPVPEVINGFWELPYQGGRWICHLSRTDRKVETNVDILKESFKDVYGSSDMTLHCRLNKTERYRLLLEELSKDKDYNEIFRTKNFYNPYPFTNLEPEDIDRICDDVTYTSHQFSKLCMRIHEMNQKKISILTSQIGCNIFDTKKNRMTVVYPRKELPVGTELFYVFLNRSTEITLECEVYRK